MPGTSKDNDEPARPDAARSERTEPQDGLRDPPADSALILQGIRALHGRLDELEHRMPPAERAGPAVAVTPGAARANQTRHGAFFRTYGAV